MKKIAIGAALGLLALLLLLGSISYFLPLFSKKETPTLTIRMPEGRPLRIAQFADLHFGDGKSMYHNTKEARTKDFLAYAVETEKPDLIICSGDQVMSANVSEIREFIALMDSYQTPWVFVWGNHDAEGSFLGHSKREVSAALANSDSPYLLYADGYTEEDRENRYGNFSIQVLDPAGERLVGALLMLDSGTYDYENEAYQEITAGQIQWYRQEIDRLQALYADQEANAGATVPTVVFAHMPLPDFAAAYRKAARGEGAEFVIEDSRFWGGADTENAPPSPLFAAMREKGSTKAYFVGHYHVSKYQVRMDGILLGFCPQAGFSHAGYDSPRNIYIYSIAEDFSITTKLCTEQLSEQQQTA